MKLRRAYWHRASNRGFREFAGQHCGKQERVGHALTEQRDRCDAFATDGPPKCRTGINLGMIAHANRTEKFAEAPAAGRYRIRAITVAARIRRRSLGKLLKWRRQCAERGGHLLEFRIVIERRHQERLGGVEPVILRTELRRRDGGVVVGACKQRQRKIAADAVKRGHESSDHAPAADVGAKPESPDRSGQKRRLPLVGERGARGRNRALQPRLPRVQEFARRPDGNEVALCRNLTVKAALHGPSQRRRAFEFRQRQQQRINGRCPGCDLERHIAGADIPTRPDSVRKGGLRRNPIKGPEQRPLPVPFLLRWLISRNWWVLAERNGGSAAGAGPSHLLRGRVGLI